MNKSAVPYTTTLFREYAPEICRWKSLDPKLKDFPSESPFSAMGNNPIMKIDPSGLAQTDPNNLEGWGEPENKDERRVHEGSSFGWSEQSKKWIYLPKPVIVEAVFADETITVKNKQGDVLPNSVYTQLIKTTDATSIYRFDKLTYWRDCPEISGDLTIGLQGHLDFGIAEIGFNMASYSPITKTLHRGLGLKLGIGDDLSIEISSNSAVTSLKAIKSIYSQFPFADEQFLFEDNTVGIPFFRTSTTTITLKIQCYNGEVLTIERTVPMSSSVGVGGGVFIVPEIELGL